MPKLKDPNVWFQNALRVTEDPAASGWLKNALVEAINRDPVDAAGDAESFTEFLNCDPLRSKGRRSRARQASRLGRHRRRRAGERSHV
jgi:hypothetical protein